MGVDFPAAWRRNIYSRAFAGVIDAVYHLQVMKAHSPGEIHALFQDAFNAGDVGALISLYEPDAILMLDGKPVTGRENLRAAFYSILCVGVQMRLTTRAIIESCAGLALLHGEWIVDRTTTESRRRTNGFSTEVVRQQPDGTWLFIIDNPRTPAHEQ
jgi:uncharacterized protein (TIGR02246 family)